MGEDGRDVSPTAGAAFEDLPVGAAVVTGPDDRVQAANAAFRRAAGRDDLVGLSVQEIGRDRLRDSVLESCAEVRRSGSAVVGDSMMAGTLTDESVMGGSFALTATPMFDDGGELVQISLVVGDVATSWLDDEEDDGLLLVTSAQDALLPKGLSVHGMLDVAATYVIGSVPQRHGGDWFDSVPLGGERVAVLVGDVPGHGLQAIATMGLLRGVLDASLRRTGDAQAALAEVEQYAANVPEARATTLVVVVLDPLAGELAYCTAGHPPPLLVPRTADPYFVPPSGSGAIGSGGDFALVTQAWEPGDCVVLYSNGSLDRPGRSRSQSTIELAAAAATARASANGGPVADRLVRHLPMALTQGIGSADDLILLAAQLLDQPVPALSVELAAVPQSLVEVRRSLDEWVDRLRLSPLDAMSLQHAVGELVANAVQHAYVGADRPGPVRVEVCIAPDGTLEVEVADRGRWQGHDDSVLAVSGGRGLNLARLLTDHLRLETTAQGTSVGLRFRPQRPAGLFTAPPGPPRRGPGRLQAEVDSGVLTLSGPLDLGGADDLRQLLGRATRGSTKDVVVDLSAAASLDSTAVQVLMDAQRACAANSRSLVLRAAPGSPAQQVLELVRLPYSDS